METFILLIELTDLWAKSISNSRAETNEISVDTGCLGTREFCCLHIGGLSFGFLTDGFATYGHVALGSILIMLQGGKNFMQRYCGMSD